MKTRYKISVISIILVSVIFGIFTVLINPFSDEQYIIEITRMKDVYLIGEPFTFSFILSGFGYACGEIDVQYPDETGKYTGLNMIPGCAKQALMNSIHFDYSNLLQKSIDEITVQKAGNYNITVKFHSIQGSKGTTESRQFYIVEKICDNQNTKEMIQCFSNTFDSCVSSYIKTDFTTTEGDPIYVSGIIESWNDCKLRMYLDTTHDRYGGESTETLSSECDGIVVKEDYWTITGCADFDFPPKVEYNT